MKHRPTLRPAGYGTRGTAEEIPAENVGFVAPENIEQRLIEILERLKGVPIGLSRYLYPVDEYRIQTIAGDTESGVTLLPQYDYPAIIESILVTGPPTNPQVLGSGNNSQGSVTSPTAGAVIASSVTPAQGIWQVSWQVSLAGTVAAADANNFGLFTGGTDLEQSINPGSVGGPWPQMPRQVNATGAQSFSVKAVGAGTAGAIYAAQFGFVSVVNANPTPSFTLQLGNRVWNLTLTPQGFCVIAPVCFVLDRTDARQLTASVPGNWSVELMGWANVRGQRS